MRGSLAGRVALITGAGNGIDQAIALRLAQEGAIVGVNDLKPAFTEKTVALIRAAGGVAEDLPGDASQREAVRSMVLGLAERRGRFDIIVNNAAWVRYGDIASITEKTYERMTAIGFGRVIWGIQAAAEAMGEPADIAEMALFLASDASRYVSGSVMLVDGGLTHAFS